MCGICGILSLDSEPIDPARLRAMADTLVHRGPDDEGYHAEGPVGFGFRRLSIVDVTGGHQPMSTPDGRVTVMVNGEIYNFAELRTELERYGHRFTSKSDSEVVLHGYRQWGDAVLDRMNGMFGLAVWDREEQRLLLARDRAGVKLLYYRISDGELVFGSELRAVSAARATRSRPDPLALNLFLRYRYIPSPLTVHTGLRKLAPGTKLVAQDGRVSVERYWDYDPTPVRPTPSPAEAEADLLRLYRTAIQRQLMSDVPLGLLLSGGVDSALLLALMREHGDQWPTYTVGYGPGYPHDELADAAATAKLFGVPHHEIRLDRAAFEADLAGVVDALEEPVASPSTVALYQLCGRVAQDVKVALIGQGPDELFGGYTRHLGVRYGAAWRALPPTVRTVVGAGLRRLPRSDTVHRGLDSLGAGDRLRRYQQVFSILPGPAVDGLFRDGVLPAEPGDAILASWADAVPRIAAADELGGFQFLELRSSLPDELLLFADKLSMRHSLELRVPYLDHEIISYAGSLPAALKIRAGRRKWLHKRLCRSFLPKEIINRPKRAFAVDVVDRWYRDSLTGKVADNLMDEGALIYQMLRPDRVRRLVADHRSGRRDHHKIIYSLVVMEDVLRRYAPA
jgi:asparagine synthase (glutamine-hydrolysing)